MTTPDAYHCLECPTRGAGPKADLDARKHGKATSHATTTHLDAPWWVSTEEAS